MSGVRLIDGTLPAVGSRVRLTVTCDDAMRTFGTIVGYATVRHSDAALWRDGREQLVALVELEGWARYLEADHRWDKGSDHPRVCTVSVLVCDLDSIEVAAS